MKINIVKDNDVIADAVVTAIALASAIANAYADDFANANAHGPRCREMHHHRRSRRDLPRPRATVFGIRRRCGSSRRCRRRVHRRPARRARRSTTTRTRRRLRIDDIPIIIRVVAGFYRVGVVEMTSPDRRDRLIVPRFDGDSLGARHDARDDDRHRPRLPARSFDHRARVANDRTPSLQPTPAWYERCGGCGNA